MWQQKYLQAETRLNVLEGENAALKDRMAKFAIIAEEVRKERRMHQEVRSLHLLSPLFISPS